MAGFIRVSGEMPQGVINVGSRGLGAVVQFLIWSKPRSARLAADADFDPLPDEVFIMAIRYLNLERLSDETIAEIGRLLMEGTDPGHPYWKQEALSFTMMDYVDQQQKAGVDVPPELLRYISLYQSVFREVAQLIARRLGRYPPV